MLVLVGRRARLSACSSDDGGASTGTETTTAAASEHRRRRLRGPHRAGRHRHDHVADFAFDPSCFGASASQASRSEPGRRRHTFTVTDTKVDVPIAAGETSTASPRAVAPGTYDFVCTFHPQMTGALKVGA